VFARYAPHARPSGDTGSSAATASCRAPKCPRRADAAAACSAPDRSPDIRVRECHVSVHTGHALGSDPRRVRKTPASLPAVRSTCGPSREEDFETMWTRTLVDRCVVGPGCRVRRSFVGCRLGRYERRGHLVPKCDLADHDRAQHDERGGVGELRRIGLGCVHGCDHG
jgi:hypothetical protein